MLNEFPKATLEQSPRILREVADERESNGSGRGERMHRTCNADAAGYRYLAALIEIGDYDTAHAMTDCWFLAQRTQIPLAVYTWMSPAFKRNNS